MEERELVPKRRFKGYEKGKSLQVKYLGNLTDIKTGPFGSTLHAKDYVKEGVPIITTEHFKEGYLPGIKQGIPQVTHKDFLRLNMYKLQAGDIVFSRVGSVDINALTTSIQNGWLFSGRVLRVRPQEQVSSLYLHYLLETKRVKQDVIARAVGQTMPSINTEILNETKLIKTNNNREQQKIGEFFKILDERIANQERKIAKVKALKAAYLTEMFPQEGETVPKRRFKGFTGEWELIKFKDIGNVKRGLTYKPSDVSNEGVRVLRSSNIEDNNFVLKQDGVFVTRNSIGIDYADNNNILITAANGSTKLIGKHAITKGLSKEKNVPGGFMLIVETDVPNFLNTSMYTSWYKKFLSVFVSGGNGSIGNLSKGDLEEQSLLIPNQQEQQKIGNFFKNLDNQIETEEKKLDKLRKMKEAYLEEMFV